MTVNEQSPDLNRLAFRPRGIFERFDQAIDGLHVHFSPVILGAISSSGDPGNRRAVLTGGAVTGFVFGVVVTGQTRRAEHVHNLANLMGSAGFGRR